MLWEIDSFSKKYLKEITDAAEGSNKIILATDPDREGEAIAWHVKEVLEKKNFRCNKKPKKNSSSFSRGLLSKTCSGLSCWV